MLVDPWWTRRDAPAWMRLAEARSRPPLRLGRRKELPLRCRVCFPRRSWVTKLTMDLGRLLLRLTIGGTFFVHGTQKLFGWFGGYGPDGTGQFFESLGLPPGRRNAIAAGSTETGCGILIALGLATPLAAAGLSAVMITALRTAIWNDGFKPATGEHEVLLAVAALALTDTGPGAPSLDSALEVERSGPGWMLAALGAGAAGSAVAISMGRQPAAPAPAAPAETPAAPEAPPAPEARTS
jgi:putative oxidoreductase